MITVGVVALFSGCEDDLVPTAAVSSVSTDLVRLDVDTPSADADGATVLTVSARVPATSKLQPRLIAFSTTAGAFVPSGSTSLTVTADDTGAAKVFLRAPTMAGTAVIRANAGSSALTKAVEFQPALPQTLEIEPSRFNVQSDSVKGSDEITITAFLRRSKGSVTRGREVTFTATKAGAAEPRIGAPTRSDSAGTVTVKYSPGPTNYRGPVTITATALGMNKVLTATTTIDIIARSQ